MYAAEISSDQPITQSNSPEDTTVLVNQSHDLEVLIAVLDSAIDKTHEDLAGKVVSSINLTDSLTASD